jgi:hypothetical protein
MGGRKVAILEALREDFSEASASRKLDALRGLVRCRLRTAGQVRRLHELLCFMRAWPDDSAVLAQVERMLQGFARRRDLREHRTALADSGIAGTTMNYPFFYPTALWLSRRWPDALHLDRRDTVAGDSIGKCLPALLTPLENHALLEAHAAGYAALDALRGRRSDASFLLDRVAAMPGDEFAREALYDLINPTCELQHGSGSPERTTAAWPPAPREWQRAPLRHARPELRHEIARAPRKLRRLAAREGAALIELARAAMVARSRDLDAFCHGHDGDAWLADDDDGLAFVLIGMQPERRPPLPATYGGLTLRNGVPVGYHQTDFLGRSAAVSFNTFETFRGGESAWQFARLLAALHAFNGATTFSIEPYQLGAGNDEGLESGAWWFYFKLGFRPRARAAQRLAAQETARLRTRRGYRSPAPVLRQLAAHHLFLDLDPANPAPLLLPTEIGLRVGAMLARLDTASREAAVEQAGVIARQRCGLATSNGFSRGERAAWTALAPLWATLPLDAWSADERASLVSLTRAKGAASERRYAQLLVALRRLESSMAACSPARKSRALT